MSYLYMSNFPQETPGVFSQFLKLQQDTPYEAFFWKEKKKGSFLDLAKNFNTKKGLWKDWFPFFCLGKENFFSK